MKRDSIDVVILCGGLGTRLRPVAGDLPKAMVPVGGRPFLDLVVDHVVHHGYRRVVFCTGYRSHMITDHFGKRRDLRIEFSAEASPLGTGGALKHAAALIRSECFLLLNGDTFCPCDLPAMVASHAAHDRIGTIGVSKPEGRSDGGIVRLGRDGRVLAFDEKPDCTTEGYLNAGVYVFAKTVLQHIPDRACSLEREILPQLIRHCLGAYAVEAPVYDIGTPERLASFASLYAASAVVGQPKVNE